MVINKHCINLYVGGFMEIGSIIEFTLLTLIATLAIDFIGRGIVSIVL